MRPASRDQEREMGDTEKTEREGREMPSSIPDDPYAVLQIVLNPDGSLTRPNIFPISPPRAEAEQPHDVFSKDVPLNPSNKTWIRIFRPQFLTPMAPLPIIIDFHGGGFILHSAASAPLHALLERVARHVPAIVLTVEYRLAPEYRLPAAYDDAIDAVRWVRDQAISDLHRDTWMTPDLADFSRCFLMGSSAGANIAYHAALRALDLDPPFKIAGVILNEPYFGGEQRTESELKMLRDRILPLHVNDLLWQLALPGGSDRDHEFCNPMTPGAHHDRVGSLPPCLVRGYGGDPLVDRQRALVRTLEERGVHVVGQFREEGCHGVELFDPQQTEAFLMDVQDFVSSVKSRS